MNEFYEAELEIPVREWVDTTYCHITYNSYILAAPTYEKLLEVTKRYIKTYPYLQKKIKVLSIKKVASLDGQLEEFRKLVVDSLGVV